MNLSLFDKWFGGHNGVEIFGSHETIFIFVCFNKYILDFIICQTFAQVMNNIF